MLHVNPAAPLGFLLRHEAAEGAAVHIGRNLCTGRLKEGGQKVAQLNGLVNGGAGRTDSGHRLGELDNIGNPCGPFISISFPPMVVVAHHVAVVGGEADNGIVIHSLLLERGNDAAHLFVDEGDGSIIVLFRILHILLAKLAVRGVGPLFGARHVLTDVAAPFGLHRSVHVNVLVKVEHPLRRVIGTVGPCKRHLEEERPVAFVMTDSFHGDIAGPHRRMHLLGQLIHPGAMVIPADTGSIGILARGHQLEPLAVIAHEIGRLHPSALVHQRGVEAMRGILRSPVHLAQSQCEISALAEHARHFVAIVLSHHPISQHAVMPG